MSDARALVSSLNFCCIDLETTGGNHENDKIFEIGLVRIRNLEITDSLEFRINPEINIPIYVQKLTSTKQKDLKDKPLIEDVIDEILAFIGDDILVAHNAAFDVPFFNSVLTRLGRDKLANRSICTHIMTKHLLPEIQKSNLTYLANLFNIDFKNAHRALSDTVLTAQILIKFLEIFAVKNIKKINQIYYPKNKFEMDRIHLDAKDTSFIEKKLSEISQTNFYYCLSFKGAQGSLTSVIPYHKDLFSLVELKNLFPKDYQKVTIQLQGSLSQALIVFKDYFLNIEKENRDFVLKSLYQKLNYERDLESSYSKFNYVLLPHIIKDHFIILNSKNLSLRSPKIFKAPGQVKKSFHLMSKQRTQKPRKNDELRKIEDLILNSILKHPKKSLRFSKKLSPEDLKNYSKQLGEFLLTHTNDDYPNYHL